MNSVNRILMLLSNAFRPDPRVAREAASLAQAGIDVTILCWDRQGDRQEELEEVDGYHVVRVKNIRSIYGVGARQILYLPRFWTAVVRRTHNIPFQVIHCHDLDTLPVGWWLKRWMGAKLVFDAHEDYPALMSQYLHKSMVLALGWLEHFLIRSVDYTITASNVYAQKLRNLGLECVTTIGNYQKLAPFDVISPEDIKAIRAQLGLDADDYVVSYIGGFSRNRLILPLIEAAQSLPDVKVLLWGDGHQRGAIACAASETNNVRYLGWLPSDQVPLHFLLSDVIYYCLLPDYPGAIYNAPNTLSNAMAAGRPIIANDVGDLGSIVRQTGCGLLISQVSVEQIRQAIISLQDRALRERLGESGKQAARREYNWGIAQGCLLEIYELLLP